MGSNSGETVEQQKPKIQIYPTPNSGVSPFWIEKYERDAKKYWDVFYKRHQDKFFKDRHYLDKEWGRYLTGASGKVLLEVGCGAGNTIFPLRATYPDVFVHACDFSQRAVDLVKSHKEYTETFINAFVCDLTSDDLSKKIPASSVDIVTMIFVLSAVSPEKMSSVVQNIKKILKPNGLVLFRDYATGDLAQERLICKDQKISENFYVRGDGTRAFYFSEEYLGKLFEETGFGTEEIEVCCKQVENRSRELIMNRRWIQAVFCLSADIKKEEHSKSILPLHTKSVEKEVVQRVDAGILTEEVDISEGVAMNMFGVSPSENEVIDINFGNLTFKINVVSKEYQHTCKSTGLMLWESARLMASVLSENPSITACKRVLELGCGCAGICSMVAAQNAQLVVASDGDARSLDLLQENVNTNLATQRSKPIVRMLKWGNDEHIDAIKEVNEGFDVILGTDVTYISEAIMPLFATAQKLISSDAATREGGEPALILCHILRRVDEPSILSGATQYGFKLVDRWPSSGTPSHSESSIMSSWFNKMDLMDRDKIPSTALSIMYFQRA